MTKKKQKKPFRVIGVTRIKNMTAYAKRVEAAMNQVFDEGYGIDHIFNSDDGMLVIASDLEEEEIDLGEALRSVETHRVLETFSKESMRIIDRLVAAGIPPTWGADRVGKAMQANIAQITHGMSSDELCSAAKELEDGAERHAATHTPGNTCAALPIFKKIAEVLREAARQRLQ